VHRVGFIINKIKNLPPSLQKMRL